MLPPILEPSSPRFQSSRIVLAQVLTDDRKIEGARSLMDAEDLLVGGLARSAVSSAEAERMLTNLRTIYSLASLRSLCGMALLDGVAHIEAIPITQRASGLVPKLSDKE